jgi:hypothetical protein
MVSGDKKSLEIIHKGMKGGLSKTLMMKVSVNSCDELVALRGEFITAVIDVQEFVLYCIL